MEYVNTGNSTLKAIVISRNRNYFFIFVTTNNYVNTIWLVGINKTIL